MLLVTVTAGQLYAKPKDMLKARARLRKTVFISSSINNLAKIGFTLGLKVARYPRKDNDVLSGFCQDVRLSRSQKAGWGSGVFTIVFSSLAIQGHLF